MLKSIIMLTVRIQIFFFFFLRVSQMSFLKSRVSQMSFLKSRETRATHVFYTGENVGHNTCNVPGKDHFFRTCRLTVNI